MTTMLEGLDGVECIADDILVCGEDTSQHNQRLTAVLDTALLRNNLTRSRRKLETRSPLWLKTAFSHRKIPTPNET